MTKQTMSEIIAAYNDLATAQSKPTADSFKNLSAARAALKSLESNTMTEQTESQESQEAETTGAPGLDTPTPSGPKYDSSAKRGPTQGVGVFCKGLIAEGKTNAEILAAVAVQFPTAKTTANCVAYYRTKMKAVVETPAEETAAEETPAEETLA